MTKTETDFLTGELTDATEAMVKAIEVLCDRAFDVEQLAIRVGEERGNADSELVSDVIDALYDLTPTYTQLARVRAVLRKLTA